MQNGGDFHGEGWMRESKVGRRRSDSAMVFGGCSQVRLDQHSRNEVTGSH